MSDPDLRDPRLDQAYRELPGDEPPPEVDERIRAAAHRAVGARPQSLEARQRSWASRWRVPLSLAATVVLAVTLTVMVLEEERPAFRSAPVFAPTPSAPTILEDRAPPSPAAEAAKRADTGPTPAPARRAPASAEPQPPPAADAAVPAATPQLQKLETRQQPLEESRPAPAAPAATPAPPKPSPLAAPPATPSGASDSLSRERAAGERPARAMRSAPQVARSPEEWIEEIRRLKAQGRDADAAAELAEFRRRHPEYPLPVDLAR